MVTHLPDRSRVEKPRPSDPDRLARFQRELIAAGVGYGPLLTGLILSLHADDAGVVEMSRAELARAVCMDLRAVVRNHLPVLTGKSWLEVEAPPPAEARRGARTRYTLLIPSEAATVTAIDPGRVPVTVRRLAKRLACTEAEAAAVIADIRAESGGRIANMGGLLRRMEDDELAEYLADVRDRPAPTDTAATGETEWCSDHDHPGGTMTSGKPRCPVCRKRAE